MYHVVNNFDDGSKKYKKGDEYKGSNADQLVKEGLVAKKEPQAMEQLEPLPKVAIKKKEKKS